MAIRDGRLSSRGVDDLARMSTRIDDRMQKVNSIANRYYNNAERARVMSGEQQMSRRTYMGLNNG